MRITLVERKGQVSCQKTDEGTSLRPRPAITDSHTPSFIPASQTEEVRILKLVLAIQSHLTSPHLTSPTSKHYNTTHRGLTTTPAPSRAPRINLPLRPPQPAHHLTHFPPNNLPNTEHGSPTAPLPPPHQALLPSKTLRLGHQIPTSEPQTRPQPIAPINRRRHDASKIVVRTIAITTSSPTTTSTLPSTLNLVPLRRRTMQLRRCATLATQSHRNHHRTTSSHALAAVARHVPIRLGIDPSIAPLSEVVGGARR
jgi:hypothetical protein